MSCGNPHELACEQALLEATAYLDGEITPEMTARLMQHLDECPPCLAQHRLEELVKGLVQRSCAQEQAPARLREQVRARIEHVEVTITQQGTHTFGFVVEHTVEEW